MTAGRAFHGRDGTTANSVVIINQAMARALWPGEDPLGQNVTLGACTSGKPNEWCEVVGVVEDVHQHGLEEAARPGGVCSLRAGPVAVPLAGGIDTLGPGCGCAGGRERGACRGQESAALYRVLPMNDVVATSVSPRRMKMLLIGVFALLALGLASQAFTE